MRGFAFYWSVLGVIFSALACQAVLGDFTLAERVRATCTEGAVQCVGNVVQLCRGSKGWENAAVCASETLCDKAAGSCRMPTCEAGERRCSDADLQLCNGTRDGWLTIDTCATAGHCSPQTGHCMEVPCEPGDRQCNGATPQTCNADRSGWTDMTPCDSAALCDDSTGTCRAATCHPGDFQCVGSELQSCAPTLDGWVTAQVCDSEALCDADNGSCLEGGCTTPGSFRCTDDGGLERCESDLTAWTPVDTCPTEAYCDAVLGACTSEPCTAGTYQCNGATLEVCNATSTGRDVVDTCETEGLCLLTLQSAGATCEPPQCADGDFHCDGAQPQLCNAARTGFRDNGAPCATAELCNEVTGTCDAPVCIPGQTRCSGAQPERCNAAQTDYEPNGLPCASSTLCHMETGTCGDVTCAAGQKRCNPDDPTHLEVCNATFDGWDACATCATSGLCTASLSATTCDDSACKAPTCALTDIWCGGTDNRTLYKCPPSRINTEAVVLDVCATAGLCQATHDDGDTTCIEPSCALTDLWCGGSGNRSLYKCPPSRINTEATVLDTCETNGLCEQAHSQNAMTCPTPACAVGQTQCGGTGNRTLRMCKSDRTGYSDCDTCDSSALCMDSLGATTCSASACHVCVAGQKQCSASQLQGCNAAHDGWTNLALCSSSALCTSSLTPASQMTCDACVGGMHGCNGAQPQVCNDPGSGPAVWADDGAECDAVALCDSATGSCICTLDDTRCNATSGNFEQCQATGWVETAVCAAGCDDVAGCL